MSRALILLALAVLPEAGTADSATAPAADRGESEPMSPLKPDLALAFARGPVDSGGSKRAWSWPVPDRFQGSWDGLGDATSFAVLEGSVAGTLGLWVLVPTPEGWLGEGVLDERRNFTTSTLPSGSAAVNWQDQQLRDPLVVGALSTAKAPTGEARVARTYLHTLTATDRPLYAVEPSWHEEVDPKTEALWEDFVGVLKDDPARAATMFDSLLASPLPASDYRIGEAARLAESREDWDHAIAFRARYRPVGSCSMDSVPEDAQREYGQTCRAAGDTACFVRVTLAALDYWSTLRTAWTSWGERASDTGVGLLAAPGVDVEKLLLGTVFAWHGEPNDIPRVNFSRLARAIDEAGLDERMRTRLLALAQDSDLDDYNRLRALWVWAHLSRETWGGPEGVERAMKDLRLPIGGRLRGEQYVAAWRADAQ